MSLNKCTFSKEKNDAFFSTLRGRINEYFKEKSISKYGNLEMVLKTTLMFSLYFIPFIIMMTGVVVSPLGVVGLWFVMALGMAGIGLCVMHDANHGVYSGNKNINGLLALSMNVIGSNSFVWKIQHNVLHHTYTNIHGADDDIGVSKLLRLCPTQERKGFHKYQHVYAWFVYGLMTLARGFVSDVEKFVRYRKLGLIKEDKVFRSEFTQLFIWKAGYFSIILGLPILLLPVSPWIIIGSFLMMHFICGFILAIIFQTAHIMPEVSFPMPNDEGAIPTSWPVHELFTTTNYAPKSRIFSWFIGGLNYQVEHHLLSDVCHIHYKNLAPIVRSTAAEFGLPYYSQRTFLDALGQHQVMLKELGR